MDLASFKQEVLAHYMDQDHLVTVDRDPGKWSTGNGLLHTGIFYLILGINNAAEYSDRGQFASIVRACWSHGISGLLDRNPGRPDKESQDDYIGIMAAAYLLSSPVAVEILNYGKRNFFSYDNTNPNRFVLSACHLRFPGLIGFYRLCCRQDPGWLQREALFFKLCQSIPDNTQTNILGWIMNQVIKWQSSYLYEEAVDWEKRLFQKYKTLGNLFSGYFGPNHPFSKINSPGGLIQ